jgi:hypothetical protein
MRRFSENDLPGAITDLVACHKFAALLAKGSPLDMSGAKAHVVDAMASSAERELASNGKLSGEQAAILLQALLKAPRMPTSEDAANRGERAVLHEELELLRTDPESRQGFLETGSPEDLEALKQIVTNEDTWKTALATADAQRDKELQILSIRSHAEQNAKVAELLEERARWEEADSKSDQSFSQLAKADPQAAAKSVGQATAMALQTNVVQRRHTDDRARMRRDSILLSLALLAWRGQHGKFPESTAVLVPDLLPEVPLDSFSEKPFDYQRRADNHVVLYSLGANQANDAGALYNDDLIIELR